MFNLDGNFNLKSFENLNCLESTESLKVYLHIVEKRWPEDDGKQKMFSPSETHDSSKILSKREWKGRFF